MNKTKCTNQYCNLAYNCWTYQKPKTDSMKNIECEIDDKCEFYIDMEKMDVEESVPYISGFDVEA